MINQDLYNRDLNNHDVISDLKGKSRRLTAQLVINELHSLTLKYVLPIERSDMNAKTLLKTGKLMIHIAYKVNIGTWPFGF